MSESKLKYFSELVSAGKHVQVQEELPDFVKNTNLRPKEKIIVSELYRNISEVDKGLKVLGKELGKSELLTVTSEELSLQVSLAYFLNYSGSKYVAARMFKNLEEVFQERGLDISQISPRWYRYNSGFYLVKADYKKATEFSKLACESMKNDRKSWWGAAINLGASLFGDHKNEEAIDHFLELIDGASKDEKTYIGSCHARIAEIHLDNGNREAALDELKKAEKILKDQLKIESITYNRTWAITHFQNGELDKAKKRLDNCLNFPNFDKMSPTVKIPIYYWQEMLNDPNLKRSERIAARSHLTFHFYSYILGRQYDKDNPIPLRQYFGLEYKESGNDVWVIDGDEIRACSYKEVIQEYNNTVKKFIDLYSGLSLNLLKEGEVKLITELQSRCISALMGCGSIGVNKWALIDFLYQQDFFHPSSGEERLKNVIKTVKKVGLEIERSKNYYFLNLPEDVAAIIPMNHSYRGPEYFFHSLKESFVRSDLENHFLIKSTAAKSWIKDWLERGIITQEGKGKSVLYHFNLE